MVYRISAIIILLIFYTIYLGKMILQKRQGIQTDQMARGKKPPRVFYTEFIMKIATYSVVLVEVFSIIKGTSLLPVGPRILGMVLGILGDIIFGMAVWTMRDSWRAGIPETDKTDMVTDGIYGFSRNPAFLGFDLVYLGILLIFFQWWILLFTAFSMLMLHLQILQEEEYLAKVFGQSYLDYRSNVRRYIGTIRNK